MIVDCIKRWTKLLSKTMTHGYRAFHYKVNNNSLSKQHSSKGMVHLLVHIPCATRDQKLFLSFGFLEWHSRLSYVHWSSSCEPHTWPTPRHSCLCTVQFIFISCFMNRIWIAPLTPKYGCLYVLWIVFKRHTNPKTGQFNFTIF